MLLPVLRVKPGCTLDQCPLMLWDWDGTLARVHHALYLMTRDLGGPRGLSERRGDRQSEREKRGKEGGAQRPLGH